MEFNIWGLIVTITIAIVVFNFIDLPDLEEMGKRDKEGSGD